MVRTRTVMVFLVLIAGWSLAAPVGVSAQGPVVQPFTAGGLVRMDLPSANYLIQAGRDDRIVVSWDVPKPGDAGRIGATIESRGAEATVTIKGTRWDSWVLVEVPAHTNLVVKQRAGDLRIRDVTGNKDVDAGDARVEIDVGSTEDYRAVEVSVRAGSVYATPFTKTKGGLLGHTSAVSSFSWSGPGKNRLAVHLNSGWVRLL